MAGAMGGEPMTAMLVTRPEPDAQGTVARLRALDIEAVAAPLMVRATLDVSLPPAEGFAAMVLTSANAVRSLADRGALPSYLQLPVLAVGEGTAREARDAGFEGVSSAAGALKDLVNAIALSGLKGPLFYPAGRHQSGDLAHALAPQGVMVVTTPIYDMVAVEAMPAGILARLAGGELAAVLVYSRRTAEIFAQLAAGLDRSRRAARAMLCISETAAEPLLEARFSRISLADRPDEDGMMTLALAFAREQTGP